MKQTDLDVQVFESQEQLSPPPETVISEKAADTLPKKGGHKILLFGGIGLGLILIVVLSLGVMMQKTPEEVEEVIPTPTPQGITKTTAMELELRRLEGLVKQADPANEPLSPPAVDMEVEF